MKKTLYLKFLLAYFIFGIFGLIVLATFVPNLTRQHLVREKAQSLYSEATVLSKSYASDLYTYETSLEDAKNIFNSAQCRRVISDRIMKELKARLDGLAFRI